MMNHSKNRQIRDRNKARRKKVPSCDLIESFDRNARAYGWEIGRGAKIDKKIPSSPDNPFHNPNWREDNGLG